MPDDASLDTFRSAVEAIVPAVDGLPGGVDLGVHEHVAELIELAGPGFVDFIALLLDSYATDVKAGSTFGQLDLAGRGEVLRALSMEESQDALDMVDALLVFSYGGVYSEWSGYDRATGELRPPASWAPMGYPGPVDGHPDYRKDV